MQGWGLQAFLAEALLGSRQPLAHPAPDTAMGGWVGEVLSPEACGRRLGAGSAGEAEATSVWDSGRWRAAVMQGACEGPGSPEPSELHSTHYRPRLVEGGDEDLLGRGQGDEAAHVRGCSGATVVLLPGLVQRADVQQRVGGIAAQDGEGVGLAQAGRGQGGCGGGRGGRADVEWAPRGQRGPGGLCWEQDVLLRERGVCKQPRTAAVTLQWAPGPQQGRLAAEGQLGCAALRRPGRG